MPFWLTIKENKRKRKDRQILRRCRRTRKAVGHVGDGDTNSNSCAWYRPQDLGEMTGGLGNQRNFRDHLDKSIAEIGQNTEKSSGDLRELSVSQTLVKDHWCETLRSWIIIIIMREIQLTLGPIFPGGPAGPISPACPYN